jgi:hypothetical protein
MIRARRRKLVRGALHPLSLMLLLTAIAASGAAPDYPTKPIRLIVGSAPGGPIDFSARLAAQKLTEALGQSVVVDNRTGAAHIGTSMSRSRARRLHAVDGERSDAVHYTHRSQIVYDMLKDFAPISTVAAVSYAVVVHPAIAAQSVQEFIALAKPSLVNYVSALRGAARLRISRGAVQAHGRNRIACAIQRRWAQDDRSVGWRSISCSTASDFTRSWRGQTARAGADGAWHSVSCRPAHPRGNRIARLRRQHWFGLRPRKRRAS